MNHTYILKNSIISFCQNLVEPKSLSGGKPRYSANFIIDLKTPEGKAQKKELEKIIADITAAEFPGRKLEGKDIFFRDGNTNVNGDGVIYDGYEGNGFISGARAFSKKKPMVVDHDPKVHLVPGDDHFPEAGDIVNAKLNFYTVNGKNDKKGDPTHGKKICCEIEVVQFVKKGQGFGASAPTTDGLDVIAEEEVNVDDL